MVGLAIGEGLEIVVGIARDIGFAIGLVAGVIQDGNTYRSAQVPFVVLVAGEREIDLRIGNRCWYCPRHRFRYRSGSGCNPGWEHLPKRPGTICCTGCWRARDRSRDWKSLLVLPETSVSL